MTIKHLRNITISEFESFLELAQCKYISTKGGHDKWTRSDLRRPIIFQNHVKPIPEFIIKNNLRVLGYSKDEFFDILYGNKEVIKVGQQYSIKENDN